MVEVKNSQMTQAIFFMLIVLLLCAFTQGKVIYVDDDATGANNGLSWENAYVYLQDALADAEGSEKPVEIHVAQGIYKPDQGVSQTPGYRSATFHLINGVAIEGGYSGIESPDPNARDIKLYETILSGDLEGNDVYVSNIEDLHSEPTRSDNSYHVVTSHNTDSTAVLNGVTVTAGNMKFYNQSFYWGAGLMNTWGSPTLLNCIFISNSAYAGAGMCSYGSGLVTLTNCSFIGNYSVRGGGMLILKTYEDAPTLTKCSFVGNTAALYGGGLYSAGSGPTLTNCIFTGNTARSRGGAVLSDRCILTLTNCTLSGNRATHEGGGIFKSEISLGLTNCIIWANEPDNFVGLDLLNDTISYSNIEFGWHDEGNIDADPLFVATGYWDPNGTPDDSIDDFWVDGDYHLKSQGGRWDIVGEIWVNDDVTSPCIDAGDPNSPVGDEPEPNGGRINMGAYGGTVEASKSP